MGKTEIKIVVGAVSLGLALGCQAAQKQVSKATGSADKQVERESEYASQLRTGEEKRRAHDYAGAFVCFGKARSLQDSAEAKVGMALSAIEGQDLACEENPLRDRMNLDAAREILVAALAQNPAVRGGHHGLALLSLATGDLATATAQLEEENWQHPENSEANQLHEDVRRRIAEARTNEEREAQAARIERDRKKREAEQAEADQRYADLEKKLKTQARTVGKLRCVPTWAQVAWSLANSADNRRTSQTSIVSAILSCKNVGSKPERIYAADFTLLDGTGKQYRFAPAGNEIYFVFDEDEPRPTIIEKFIDIPAGEEAEIGLAVELLVDLTNDKGLRLDFRGAPFKLAF